MRTLTFKCEKHGIFELDFQNGEDIPIWCPVCNNNEIPCGKKLKRKYDVPTIKFKGSGFYSTDNRQSN